MTDLHISRQITLRPLPSALCETRKALSFSQETATNPYPDESSLHPPSLLLRIGKHLPIFCMSKCSTRFLQALQPKNTPFSFRYSSIILSFNVT